MLELPGSPIPKCLKAIPPVDGRDVPRNEALIHGPEDTTVFALEQREDVCFTTKRHPAKIRYRAAVREGRVTGIDRDRIPDAGACEGLTSVVLQRGLFCCLVQHHIGFIFWKNAIALLHNPSALHII